MVVSGSEWQWVAVGGSEWQSVAASGLVSKRVDSFLEPLSQPPRHGWPKLLAPPRFSSEVT